MSRAVPDSPSTDLPITVVDMPGYQTSGGARLGLTHCPGRCGGAYGQRNLDADLATIDAFGAEILITLVEAHEFHRLGVPDFADQARRRSFRWYHVPIPDFGTPSATTWPAWDAARDDVRHVIDRGGCLALHCAAGLGRTGTIAAKLLSERGLTADAAIAEIRRLRPGTIETAEQVEFVVRGPRLL
jgi:ADP-ribosyl-[dinitrogen reductase] hydrolase